MLDKMSKLIIILLRFKKISLILYGNMLIWHL